MPKNCTALAAIWPPTSDVAREAGHKPQSPLQAIREKCRDCSSYQLNEIRACGAVNCALVNTPGGAKAKNPAKPSLIPTGKPPSRTKGPVQLSDTDRVLT